MPVNATRVAQYRCMSVALSLRLRPVWSFRRRVRFPQSDSSRCSYGYPHPKRRTRCRLTDALQHLVQASLDRLHIFGRHDAAFAQHGHMRKASWISSSASRLSKPMDAVYSSTNALVCFVKRPPHNLLTTVAPLCLRQRAASRLRSPIDPGYARLNGAPLHENGLQPVHYCKLIDSGSRRLPLSNAVRSNG